MLLLAYTPTKDHPMLSSGTLANNNGRQLEAVVEIVLRQRGLKAVPSKSFRLEPEAFGSEVLETHVPFDSVYGGRGYTEYVIHSSQLNKNIRLDCKWQQVGGSVDEKFPNLLLNLYNSPEEECIILVDGGGARDGAIEWLRETTDRLNENAEARKGLAFMGVTRDVSNKKVHVFTLNEWLKWVNQSFGGK